MSNPIPKMPPKFLWSGEARLRYLEMCRASAYAARRRSAAPELAAGIAPETVLLIGAGPDPSTEIDVLSRWVGKIGPWPGSVAVCDLEDAEGAAALVADAFSPRREHAPSLRREQVSVFPSFALGAKLPARVPRFDAATLLGYTLGNLSDEEAEAALVALHEAAARLLLDVPVASWDSDPRCAGRAWAPGAEEAWLTAAAHAWRGGANVFRQEAEPAPGSGYVARVVAERPRLLVAGGPLIGPAPRPASAEEAEVIRYRRREAWDWIRVASRCGWDVSAAKVVPGSVPALSLLLSSRANP